MTSAVSETPCSLRCPAARRACRQLPEADWLAVSEDVTPTGDPIRTLSQWGVDGQSTHDDLEAQTACLLEQASEAVERARGGDGTVLDAAHHFAADTEIASRDDMAGRVRSRG